MLVLSDQHHVSGLNVGAFHLNKMRVQFKLIRALLLQELVLHFQLQVLLIEPDLVAHFTPPPLRQAYYRAAVNTP